VLNTSIIIKHRLRENEIERFPLARRTATKILVPIESGDLRVGARYVFIGQRRFQDSLFDAFGLALGADTSDMRTLAVLDESPTFDPFLLREMLRHHDLEPARCYFELSPADAARMYAFAQTEIGDLVQMCFGAGGSATHAGSLARKILANSADKELEPLRLTLQLDLLQFQEGVFCWKAFLYYKWQLSDLLPRVASVLREIEQVKPRGPQSAETRAYLSNTRESLRKILTSACKNVKATLAIYDKAYAGLTRENDPNAFRSFLLKAPAMFKDLGERLGAVEHIVSFWRFRFPEHQPASATPEELTDIFMDFENSLAGEKADSGSALPAPQLFEMM
jgi:hypothetical protein